MNIFFILLNISSQVSAIDDFQSINFDQPSLYFSIASFLIILLPISLFIIILVSRLYLKTKKEYLAIQRLFSNLPIKPKACYLYYDNSKKLFCSPTFLKRLGIEQQLKKIEDSKSYFTYYSFLKMQERMDLYLEELNKNYKALNMNALTLYTTNDDILLFTGQQIVSEFTNKTEAIIFWFFEATDIITELNIYKKETCDLKLMEQEIFEQIKQLPFPLWIIDKNSNLICSSHEFQKIDSSYKIISKSFNLDKFNHVPTYTYNIDGDRKVYKLRYINTEINNVKLGYGIDLSNNEKLKNEIDLHIEALNNFISSFSTAIAIFNADTRLVSSNSSFKKLWNLEDNFIESNPKYGEILDELRNKRKLPEQISFSAFKKQQNSLFRTLTETYYDFFYLPEGKTLKLTYTPHSLGGLLIAFEDISYNLNLERTLNSVVDVSNVIIDNIEESVAVFESSGRLKIWNMVFCKQWELNDSYLATLPHYNHIINATVQLYSKSQNITNFQEKFIIALEKRISSNYRYELNNGQIFERKIIPLPDGSILVSDLNISDSIMVERDLKERNAILQDLDKIKTEFLAAVSYEIRSPLTTIIGYSELIDKLKNQDEIIKYSKYINDAAQSLHNIVNDSITLASLNAQEINIFYHKFDLVKLLTTIINNISGTKIRFHTNISVLEIEGDERKICRVIQSLITTVVQDKSCSSIECILSNDLNNNNVVVIFKIEQNYLAIHHNKNIRTSLSYNLSKSIIELHNGTISSFQDDQYLMIEVVLPKISIEIDA